MSEKEKKLLETIAEALPNMDPYDQGYFMGRAEEMARQKRKKRKSSSEGDKKTA